MNFKQGILYFYKKGGRVFWQAAIGFQRDHGALRASALTLYTLFSIVPVMAMAFGIAKGFGFQKILEREVLTLFAGREEIVSNVLVFSSNLLEKTKGGLMAVLGVILLFYSLIKLMAHIESTFNQIWWVKSGRSLVRKVTDYLTISLAAGLLVLFSGSANIFMATRLEKFLDYLGVGISLEGFISFGLNLFPYVSTWLLFIFFYLIMPNKKVDIRAAVLGGIVAGTLFQLIQMAYLNFQIGVASYNAIYGSFAALPLFLIWIQVSWVVMLYGAEIAFEWENTDLHQTRSISFDAMSLRSKKMMMLGIVRICVIRFAQKQIPVTETQIAGQLNLPLNIVRHLLEKLMASRVLFSVNASSGQTGYSPAMDIECMTIMDVLTAVDIQGDTKIETATMVSQALEASLDDFDNAARGCIGERKIKDI